MGYYSIVVWYITITDVLSSEKCQPPKSILNACSIFDIVEYIFLRIVIFK